MDIQKLITKIDASFNRNVFYKLYHSEWEAIKQVIKEEMTLELNRSIDKTLNVVRKITTEELVDDVKCMCIPDQLKEVFEDVYDTDCYTDIYEDEGGIYND